MLELKTPAPTSARRKTGVAAAIGGVTLITGALLTGTGTTAQAAPEAGDSRFPVSVESMDARRAEIFAAIDTNGDGLISAEEFDAHEPPARGKRHAGDTGRPHGHPKSAGHRPDPSADQIASEIARMDESLFQQLDSNGDGVLSQDEFSREAMMAARRELMKLQIFAHADQNDDGYLSPDEFPPRRLADMDANADGEVTRDELRAHRQPSAG